MPLKKELFEYVKVIDPDIVKTDLQRTSHNIHSAIQDVQTQLDLDQEKHVAITEAKKLSKDILRDIKELNESLLRGTFKEMIGKQKVEKIARKVKPKVKKFEPEKLTIQGKAAIKHLRKNIFELKRELGVE